MALIISDLAAGLFPVLRSAEIIISLEELLRLSIVRNCQIELNLELSDRSLGCEGSAASCHQAVILVEARHDFGLETRRSVLMAYARRSRFSGSTGPIAGQASSPKR